MIINRTYKFKLYKNKKNKSLNQKIDIAGIIYNHCIALHRKYYRIYGKHLNQYALMKHLTKLKKREKYAYWNLVGSQAIQDIVQRIERSYNLFFHNLKTGIKASPPGFKKVKKYKSFTLKQAGWKLLDNNKICIGNKLFKYSMSRELPVDIKTVTIKRDALGDLWLCFSAEEEIKIPDRTGKNAVGYDFGLKTFLVGSDGSSYESPLYYQQALKDLKKAHQNLSGKQSDSNNRCKARKNLVRIYRRIVDCRRDYFFKLAHEITDKYDYIFLEDLNLKGMQHTWGRKVQDLSHGNFVEVLKYVARLKGKEVIFVDRYYPSTKRCHICGEINCDLLLSTRTWVCGNCRAFHDRDSNAAINILVEGASSIGLGDVRPCDFKAISA